MTQTPPLSPAMQRAMTTLRAQGKVWAYNGISFATAEALETRGLAVVDRYPASHSYGSLGAAGGRGRWTANWAVRLPVHPKD